MVTKSGIGKNEDSPLVTWKEIILFFGIIASVWGASWATRGQLVSIAELKACEIKLCERMDRADSNIRKDVDENRLYFRQILDILNKSEK